VQGPLTAELKNTQFVAWLNSLQKALDIKMESEVPSQTTSPASK
jgi:hypothetical protein